MNNNNNINMNLSGLSQSGFLFEFKEINSRIRRNRSSDDGLWESKVEYIVF